MTVNFFKQLGFLSLPFFLILSGCNVLDDWSSGSTWIGSPYANDDYDPYEDSLLVSGSGENIVLEYNELTFSAQLNWQDGNYYFAPDADGSISGNKIVCVAEISDSSIDGDCFRDGQVCHFSYYDSWQNDSDKDSYYLSSTSCKTGGAIGPFLVPLDAPLCGQDPFPACVDSDLFPQGPIDPIEPETEEETVSAVDYLINSLCSATVRCNPELELSQCIGTFNQYYGGVSVPDWSNLGLADIGNTYSSQQVRESINEGSIQVNDSALYACISSLNETCDNVGESAPIVNIEDAEILLENDEACSNVFSNNDEVQQ